MLTPTTTTTERPTILGDELPCHFAGQSISTEVYAKVLDAETKEETGFIRRVRYRTIREVFHDLHDALDIWICPKCGHEQPKDPDSCAWQEDCPACDERMESLIDEYFYNSVSTLGHDNQPCGPYVEIIVNAHSGGSEGHHVSVGCLKHQTDEKGEVDYVNRRKPLVYEHWFHYKTLREGETGMDRAFAFARRVVRLLGL